jgi:tetratricopeptide (TPR) repeat protein
MSELKYIADNKYKIGHYEKAIELYTLCLDDETPNKHFIYSNRCLAFIKLGKYTNALNDAKKIIKLNPEWAKGWARLGTCLELTNNKEKAEVAYRKAYELEPSNSDYERISKQVEPKDDFMDNIKRLKDLNKTPNNKMIEKMLSNDKILNKVMDINFQQKIMSMSKNPMDALKDKETMELMIEMMRNM